MFNSSKLEAEEGEILFQDRFKTVELGIAFKRVKCYNCDLESVYKYQVQEVRRSPEISASEEEEVVREDHLELWKAVPRYAEIPETVKCKRCGEVLGLYTECIY